jgi:hypothetical protein
MPKGKSIADAIASLTSEPTRELPRTKHKPFGFDQGDPLVVCLTPLHMEYVQKAFMLKAFYIPHWNTAITGHRHDKIIVFRPFFGGNRTEEEKFYRWFKCDVRTHLSPGCLQEVYLV